jgi:Ca2+-binding RTX toxin-like protein
MDMRVSLISLAVSTAIAGALVAAALAPPASAQSLSPGCEDANDPIYDGLYRVAGWLLTRDFAAGERLSASAGPPTQFTQFGTPTTVTLSVNGVDVDTAAFPGTVEYAFPAAGAFGALWNIDSGAEATWTVGCTRQAPLPQTSASCAGRAATIAGSAGADRLAGTRGAEVIVGGRGNDRIRGGGGNDLICAGPGNDRAAGGGGDDRLLGGPGRDRLSGGPGRDRLHGGRGNDRLTGGPGIDAASDFSAAKGDRQDGSIP